jgi:hypothetical protein
LRDRDVPSHGLSSRIPGRTTGRVHYVLSNLEAATFDLLDAEPAVLDIREQFPLLPVAETDAIARALKTHPARAPGAAPGATVMTTDFLVTTANPSGVRHEAIACKPSRHLTDRRVLQKLYIEREFWAARDVPWRIITEREIPPALLHNTQWSAAAWDVRCLPVAPARIRVLADQLARDICERPQDALAVLCLGADDREGVTPGAHLRIARHAIARGWWVVDMRAAIYPTRPLQLRAVRFTEGL